MRKYRILLLVLLTVLACSDNKDEKTIIVGTIKNCEAEIQLQASGIDLKNKITADNTFKFVIDLTKPDYLKLKTNNTEISLYLFPGDSINVNFDDSDWISTVKYSGDRVNEQVYLMDYAKLYNSVADTFDMPAYYSQEPEKFIKIVDYYKQSFTDKLISAKKDIDSDFFLIEQTRIKYLWYFDKNTYPKNHEFYTNEKALFPNNYFDYLNDINLNDSTLLELSDYTDFLKTFIEMKLYFILKDNENKKYDRNYKVKQKLEIIEKYFTNYQIRDYLLGKTMYAGIEDLAVDSIDIDNFEKLCKNQNTIQAIRDKYTGIFNLLKGKPAPNFSLNLDNGGQINLTDFKGKYLYIDIWSTYCAPCLREMPYLSQLEHEYQNNNIVFLGVCVESKKELWEKIINDKKPAGTQIWLDKEQSKRFKENFLVTAQPTYILIDRDGNYIDSRAPRPTENIREIINKLDGI